MTEKEKTLKTDSKYESSEKMEFHKGGFKEKTLSMLKSFMDRIGRTFEQVTPEDLQYTYDRVEEIRLRYF